ncbi:hypothetical protein pdam_00009772 [Pocillopora damicornis]|uniref:Anillin homology domain-containing protein n=1 Tax=Pocillopora damicornis TaxID=46731 RepID=A0A3M6UZR4_POCDA|nr:hypothetical protein pdam_00009772 [Pocillopora damicornis]
MLYLSSMAVFHTIVWISKPKVSYFTTLATGVEAQFFAQCTAITTCHEFVMSSFALEHLYYVSCLQRLHVQVLDTALMETGDESETDIPFDNIIVFENVSYDLKLGIEISKQSFRSEKATTRNSSGPRKG